MSSRYELIETVIRETSLELVAAYGLVTEGNGEGEEEGEQLAAAIGFTASGYRGSLVLAVARRVLEEGRPRATTAPLDDWTAELCNQLLGRVKNRLLVHGPPLTLALPVSISGSSLRIGSLDDPLALHHEFRSGALRVLVNMMFDPGFDFAPNEAEPAAEPGALVLF